MLVLNKNKIYCYIVRDIIKIKHKMKPKENTPIQFNVASFDFYLRPITFSTKELPPGEYHLEFEKGLQLIKSIDEKIKIGNSKDHCFQLCQDFRVKFYNTKHSAFAWSIYRNDADSAEYVDSIKINLNDYYQLYTAQIKNYNFQYNRIIQLRASGQPLGFSWKSMKAQLKNANIIKQAVNETGTIKIKFSLEIKCDLDYLTEKQHVKIKLFSKGSMESEAKSTSSRNSLRPKKEDLQSTEKILEKPPLVLDSVILQDPLDLMASGVPLKHQNHSSFQKPFSSLQQNDFISQMKTVNSPKQVQNIEQQHQPKIQLHYYNNLKSNHSNQILQTPPFSVPQNITEGNAHIEQPIASPIPVNLGNTFIKPNLQLSDVVEASFEGGSSKLNSGDGNDCNNKEQEQINDPQINSGFSKRKTFNFGETIKEKNKYRRTNTHQSIKNSSHQINDNEEVLQDHELYVNSDIKQTFEADTRENSAIKHSDLSENAQQIKQGSKVTPSAKRNVLSIAFVLLILILFLLFAHSFFIPLRSQINKNLKRNFFKKGPRILKQSMQLLLNPSN